MKYEQSVTMLLLCAYVVDNAYSQESLCTSSKDSLQPDQPCWREWKEGCSQNEGPEFPDRMLDKNGLECVNSSKCDFPVDDFNSRMPICYTPDASQGKATPSECYHMCPLPHNTRTLEIVLIVAASTASCLIILIVYCFCCTKAGFPRRGGSSRTAKLWFGTEDTEETIGSSVLNTAPGPVINVVGRTGAAPATALLGKPVGATGNSPVRPLLPGKAPDLTEDTMLTVDEYTKPERPEK